MTRFVPLSSAAALMLALAGCGAEPAQVSAATPDQSEVPAGEAPTMVETMPAAEAAATAADPAPSGWAIGIPATCVSSAIWCGSPRSEEHTSELQSLMRISYAVFCLKKQNTQIHTNIHTATI